MRAMKTIAFMVLSRGEDGYAVYHVYRAPECLDRKLGPYVSINSPHAVHIATEKRLDRPDYRETDYREMAAKYATTEAPVPEWYS